MLKTLSNSMLIRTQFKNRHTEKIVKIVNVEIVDKNIVYTLDDSDRWKKSIFEKHHTRIDNSEKTNDGTKS